jgi:hypothetical protein
MSIERASDKSSNIYAALIEMPSRLISSIRIFFFSLFEIPFGVYSSLKKSGQRVWCVVEEGWFENELQLFTTEWFFLLVLPQKASSQAGMTETATTLHKNLFEVHDCEYLFLTYALLHGYLKFKAPNFLDAQQISAFIPSITICYKRLNNGNYFIMG